MLFYDMTPGDRDRVLQWVRDHDWGRIARFGAGLAQWTLVDVTETIRLANGALTDITHSFDDLQALRDWAGY